MVVSAYRANTTSPCSVTLRRPSTLPGGWAVTALCSGPPPRPNEPPRPWNIVRVTSFARAQATIAACALARVRVAAAGPTSFAESE